MAASLQRGRRQIQGQVTRPEDVDVFEVGQDEPVWADGRSESLSHPGRT
jgi:hypothetical protein